MNSFYNPLFLLKVLKSYFFDIDRLDNIHEDELNRFRDKQLRRVLRFADTVPLYHNLYKKQGIRIEEIKGIEDIEKLPIITKENFAGQSPSDLITRSSNIENFIKVSTSGTTGKSLSLYVTMYEIILGLFGYLRTIRAYDLSWRKHKLSIIADFAPHTAETGYVRRGIIPQTWFRSIYDHIQWLDTNDKPEAVMDKLEKFQPDFIGGYTGMLGHLAVLKHLGAGPHVSPKYIASTGALLDSHLKSFIEKTFDATVYEVYGATESGPIAYQCKKQSIYHVLSDFLHIEYADPQGNPVASKQPGKLIVTKLYSGGTPIIRYNAINDVVAPLYETHDCSYPGGYIHRIYGRDNIRLYRKDGYIVLASSLTEIFSRLLYELHTSKVRDMKVIQKDLDNIEISLVIDENLKDIPPTVEEISSVFQDGFTKKFGDSVTISIKEIKKVTRKEPRILSDVDPDQLTIKGFK
ncbi:phenylacetate--CoA ligase family protein [Pseudomonadota bacterium]